MTLRWPWSRRPPPEPEIPEDERSMTIFICGSEWGIALAGAYQCMRCGALAVPGKEMAGALACPVCGGETWER